MTQKNIIFELPFGRETGWGHLVRGAVLAAAAREAGYRTSLWSDGKEKSLPHSLVEQLKISFDEIHCAESTLREELPLALQAQLANCAMIIVSDTREIGKREDFWKRLKATRVPLAIFDGQEGMEFAYADKIISVDLALTASAEAAAKEKLCRGFLLRKDFWKEEPLDAEIPSKSFAVVMGGTDPQNLSLGVLEGLVASGYNPVLLARQKTEATESLEEALGKYPDALWMEGLSAGKLAGLLRRVAFAVVAPSSSLVAECFAARCPVIAVAANPTLKANIEALHKLNFPIVEPKRVKNAKMGFAPDAFAKALEVLKANDLLDKRLPEKPPFSALTPESASNLLKSLGL